MRRHPLERPENFELNTDCQLAQGLVFAGLGRHTKTTRYHDSSLYGNHGTLTNMDPATDWVWSNELQRLVLDFVAAQYVECPPLRSVISGPTFTMSVWFKWLSGSLYCQPMGSESDQNSATESACFFGDGGGTMRFIARGCTIAHGSTPFTGTAGWQHLVGLQTQVGYVYLYINGKEEGRSTYPANFNAVTAVPLTVGGRHPTMTNYNSIYDLVGLVSDPLIHNRPLSAAEIAILANRSDPMLGGLILPPKRRLWGVSLGGVTPAYRNLILGGGVL
jgi:hypothetical protein